MWGPEKRTTTATAAKKDEECAVGLLLNRIKPIEFTLTPRAESNFSVIICLGPRALHKYSREERTARCLRGNQLQIANRNFGWHSPTTLFWRPLSRTVLYIYIRALYNKRTTVIECLFSVSLRLPLSSRSKFTPTLRLNMPLSYSSLCCV